MDVSLLCQFATWVFRHLHDSPPGRFTTCLNVCNLPSGGKTSRNVAKHPGVKMYKGVKRPGGEPST